MIRRGAEILLLPVSVAYRACLRGCVRGVQALDQVIGNRWGMFAGLLIMPWALSLITWVTYRVFGESPPDITGGTAAAYTAAAGLLGVVVGLLGAARKKADQISSVDDPDGGE